MSPATSWSVPGTGQPLTSANGRFVWRCHHVEVTSNGVPERTIWLDPDHEGAVHIIDQRRLPHSIATLRLTTVDEVADAISDMAVRGAGCIGATAAYGMYLASVEGIDPTEAATQLGATRPTAVNLAWALGRQLAACEGLGGAERIRVARATAEAIAADDVDRCRRIGAHGFALIAEIHERTGAPVQILTHCNAGWLAFVEHGSATAPIYAAQRAGVPVHVWVDETRPRNQGARLTAWELGRAGVEHTVIVDNLGGHLMQHSMVDMVIVGSDRTTANGDVANKIGTYLKALAARDNDVPFYAAMPASTIDWILGDGLAEIPIEQRAGSEVAEVEGWLADGVASESGEPGGGEQGPTDEPAGDGDAIDDAHEVSVEADRAGRTESVRVVPVGTNTANYGFDVTPARLVTGIITENGIAPASRAGLAALHPELSGQAPGAEGGDQQ